MKPRHLLLPVLLAYSIAASANGYLGLSFGSSSVKADLASLGGGSIDESNGIYGVAFVPLAKRTFVLVKAGGASWDADLQRNATGATADGFDMLYGLGFSYGFTKNLAVTADWEVIDSPNPEFSTVSLGFKWEFD